MTSNPPLDENELQRHPHDLESQTERLDARASWQRSARSLSTHLGSTSASIKSNLTNAFSLRSRAPPRSKNRARVLHQPGELSVEIGNPDWPRTHRLEEEDRRDPTKVSRAFAVAAAGRPLRSEIVQIASQYYINVLTARCRAAWSTIIRPVLRSEACSATEPSQDDMCRIFELFLTMVLLLKDSEDLSLSDLVDAVDNKGLLRFTDEQRSHAAQLVFSAFGWITMLYNPSLSPESNSLQILNSPTTFPSHSMSTLLRRRLRHKSQTFSTLKQDLQLLDQPLPRLLKVFGEILPRSTDASSNYSRSPFLPMARFNDPIEPTNISFFTLHKLLSINIEWVDCLSLHLELDSREKVLKIFRFPSTCLVMCNKSECCMARLFSDFNASEEFSFPIDDHAGDYFKEVILSYCLLFGQHTWSYGSYSIYGSQWQLPTDFGPDPLLEILCGQYGDNEGLGEILDEIDAVIPVDSFSMAKEFTYLSSRLLIIQNTAQCHQPTGIGPLWHDNRDTYKWWTLWAVIIIGVLALLLGAIQTLLQACQLYYTVRPK